MSAFSDKHPNIIKESYYLYGDKPKQSYFSSNSPIIHIMMKEYDDKDLEIILLVTKEAKEKNEVVLKCSNEKHLKISSVDFLQRELQYTYHLKRLEKEDSTTIYTRNNNNKIVFKELPIDSENQYETITRIVDEITTIPKEEIDHLWIDPHGGPRDFNISMLGILSLLHNFHITPEYIFDLKYDTGEHISFINNNDEIYAIYDFVSAMNTFYNSQNADLLIDYFNSIEQEKYPAAKQTAYALKVISDGLQFCDPELYKNGITKLGSVLDGLSNDNSYFSLFKSFIEDEFRDSIVDGEFKPLSAIERCLNNALYQQALTFIESFMPQQYVDYRLLFFSDDKVTNVNEQLVRAFFKDLLEDNFFKEKTVKGNKEDKNELGKRSIELMSIINNKLKDIKISEVEDSSFILGNDSFDFLSYTKKEYSLTTGNSNSTLTYPLLTDLKQTDSHYHKAILSIIMFCVIVRIRNNVNHGNDTVLDYNQIIQFLSHYIEITKNLFDTIDEIGEK